MTTDIQTYHQAQTGENKLICERLQEIISKELKTAESKVWHGHPVWFLDGNPIVGYAVRKDSVQLLFWSGQSFKAKGLKAEGTFKAAEMRYTSVKDIKVTILKSWLKDSKTIQWDYKNIVKRKGELVKLAVK